MKLKSSLLWGTALGILALVLLLGSADTTRAGTFNPSLDVIVEDPTGGATSDYTVELSVPLGDVQFAGLVIFIPPEWGVTPGEEIPIGTIVGTLRAEATLGLINGACNNVLPVEFIMLNASLDINDNVAFEDDDLSGTGDVFEDVDENAIIDGADKYPDFITRVFEKLSGETLQPIRRSAGTTIVAGIDILLQFLVFEPGTFISDDLPSDPEFGYPTVTLLQAIGDPEQDPEPGAITDFCTPLSTSNTTLGLDDSCDSVVNDDPDDDDLINDGCPALGGAESEVVLDDGSDPCANNRDDDRTDDLGAAQEAGTPLLAEERVINDGCPQAGDGSEADIEHVLFTNPPEGTYTFTTIAVGQRDADADGIENTLDTCPFDINLGDPREGGDADEDRDGMDAACDPNDNETNSDQDADGYLNRQDNCPLDANGEDEDNQADDDTDGIGDVCDPNPDDDDAQGLLIFAETPHDVTIGPGEAPSDETPANGEPDNGVTTSEDDDGGGAIFIIIGIIAAVVVLGGGAFYFMRRGNGGSASA